MAETGNGKKGTPTQDGGSTIPIQARVLNQYIKDLSFENPNIRKLMEGPGDPPNLKVEVNVNAEKLDTDVYESAIQLRASAENNVGTVYVFECVYAGLFKIESIPETALEPFLLISAPMTIFPFLRRLAADVTREGGFPPLLLDPIDFAGLYFARREEMAKGQGKLNA